MARREFETLTPQMFYILLALYDPLCGLEIMEKVNEYFSIKWNSYSKPGKIQNYL